MREVLAVLEKDLRSEFRMKYALNTLLMFSIVTVVVVSFTVGVFSLSQRVSSALLWVILFFASTSGLSRTFVKEEEGKTIEALKLSLDGEKVLIGKMLFNLSLMLSLEIIIVPLFVVLLNFKVQSLISFLLILFFGTCGLVTITTMISAIISKTKSKGELLAVLSFPLLLPLLLPCIQSTYTQQLTDLKFILSFSVVMFVSSLMLFDYIWKE
ncbi:MAG: heme exporter protein CcmB [Candidatus Methanofastidiosia archaeon]